MSRQKTELAMGRDKERGQRSLRSLQVFSLQPNVVLAGMLLASVLFLCFFVAVNTIRLALKVCRVLSSCSLLQGECVFF